MQPKRHKNKNSTPPEEEETSPPKSEDSASKDMTLLVETSIFVGAIYLYLASGMFYASFFLFLLDSAIDNEARFVHTLAWVWRSGVPVLFASYYLGWKELFAQKDKSQGKGRPSLAWIFGAFPIWLVAVLVVTLLMDAVDEILFK